MKVCLIKANHSRKHLYLFIEIVIPVTARGNVLNPNTKVISIDNNTQATSSHVWFLSLSK